MATDKSTGITLQVYQLLNKNRPRGFTAAEIGEACKVTRRAASMHARLLASRGVAEVFNDWRPHRFALLDVLSPDAQLFVERLIRHLRLYWPPTGEHRWPDYDISGPFREIQAEQEGKGSE